MTRPPPLFTVREQGKPTLFAPTVTRTLQEFSGHGSQILEGVTPESWEGLSLGSSSSFRYDLPEDGLKSTQQLNVDWSEFSNHTFFQSAQAKTQVAFDRILNQYPFNGTQSEVEEFLDSLTGFESWVYSQLPKYTGYLFLTGSNTGDTTSGAGAWFRVYDSAGLAFSGLSNNQSGTGYLDPGWNSMTVEFHLYLPGQENNNQTVLCKLSSSADLLTQHGWAVVLSQSASTTTASLQVYISSGSYLQTTTMPVVKGSWQHVALVWNRNPGVHKVWCYLDQVLVSTSSNALEFGTLDTRGTSMFVGTGSQVRTGTFVPVTTLSGAIDELRIWHQIRSQEDLQAHARKGVFAQSGLQGYWKMNEVPGVATRLVTDHSGHDLHGELGSQAIVLGTKTYNTSSLPVGPMTHEEGLYNPVLFPGFTQTTGLRSRLLTSGSKYDLANPNLITKLVPKHFLLEGQAQDSLSTEEGPLLSEYQSETEMRTGKLSSSQVMVLLLYVWAKYFDEMKLFLDSFGTLLSVDYDSTDTIPDVFLQWFANQHGFSLPQLFRNSSIQQFINGEDLGLDPGVGEQSLQEIQNQIWRRILVNFQEIIRSKGTMSALKTFIRCLGVEPDETVRIREFGGPNHRVLENSRERRSEVISMFSYLSGALVKSPYLSASRVEPGIPYPVGPLNTDRVSTNLSDGLLTSGSWTWEGLVKWEERSSFYTTQSLVRFYTTGSNTIQGEGSLVANLVAFNPGTVCLYLKSSPDTSFPYLKLELSGSTIMDGSPWYVSFGRNRGGEVGLTTSGSWFLRVAKQTYGSLTETWSTSSLLLETPQGSFNVWSVLTGSWNASGSWFQTGFTGSGYTLANHKVGSFLNDSTAVPDQAARFTGFHGRMGQVRLWSKGLTSEEWLEHARNPKSLGVEDPTTNFNFVGRQVSGSWERLRLDVSMDQPEISSSAGGTMTLIDFSQNARHLTGSGMVASSPYILPERVWYTGVGTRFDEASNPERVRVRGYTNYHNVLSSSYAEVAPVYALTPSETPMDDTRLSIDFSIIDALNQDMALLFSGLGWFDNAIGNPELLFAEDYPALRVAREVYFNRLTEKINIKGWFEFYKWFDMNAGWFISQILPRRTKFMGVNYVIEDHMLHRPKVQYQWEEHYLGDSNRSGLDKTILLSLYTGTWKRY